MVNQRSEEEKIIKDIKNLFTLEKKLNDTAIKGIRNLFWLKRKLSMKKKKIISNQ